MLSRKNTGAARLKAERVRRRLVCLTNIPTPYRLHCFRALHRQLALRDWDFEVLFMAPTERGRYWRFSADQFDFPHRFLAGKSPVIAGAALHINPRIIRDLRPSPQVLLMAGAWGLPTNLLVALRPGITRRSKLIFWSESHVESMRHTGWLIEALRKRFISRYDGFAVPGQRALDYVQRYAPDKPVYGFPNTVNEAVFRDEVARLRPARERLRSAMKLPGDKRILLIPARLIKEKGIVEFLTALSGLPASIQQAATLLIAGDGPLREPIRQQIARNGALDVRLLGHLTEREMVKLYAIADGFALPSMYDPNPLSVIEALWARLPLLLSNKVGNHPEALQAGENGWLFAPESGNHTRDAFMQWCNAATPELIACGNRSSRLAEERFETQAVVNAFLSNLLEQWSPIRSQAGLSEAEAG